jgi:hypothetical protein
MTEAALEVRRGVAFAGVSIDKALLCTSKVLVPLCIAIESNLTPVPKGLPGTVVTITGASIAFPKSSTIYTWKCAHFEPRVNRIISQLWCKTCVNINIDYFFS